MATTDITLTGRNLKQKSFHLYILPKQMNDGDHNSNLFWRLVSYCLKMGMS